jgi:hypothetical protein
MVSMSGVIGWCSAKPWSHASPAFQRDDDPDDEFVFGLERILDGVATLVRSR